MTGTSKPATRNHDGKGSTLMELPSEILRKILMMHCETTEDVRDLLSINLVSSMFHKFFKENAGHFCLAFARKQEMMERVILENTYQIRNKTGCWRGKELVWLIDGRIRAAALRKALYHIEEVRALETYASLCNFQSTTLDEYNAEHLSRRIRVLILGTELCAINTKDQAFIEGEEGVLRLYAASRGMLIVIIALVQAIQKRIRAEPMNEMTSVIAGTSGEYTIISRIHKGWTQQGASWFTKAMATRSFRSVQEFRDCFLQPSLGEASTGPFDLDNLPLLLGGMTLQSSAAQAWDAALSGTRRTAYAEWQALVPDEASLEAMLRQVGWSRALPERPDGE